MILQSDPLEEMKKLDIKQVKKLTYGVNTLILFFVLGLMYFFKLCNASFLVAFSIPTIGIYLLGYFLIWKEKLNVYVWMVFLWITLYMCLTTVFLGYNYGFHLYCFSMIPIMFASEYISYKLERKSLKALYVSLGIAIFYMLCTGYVSIFKPVYESEQKMATIFWVCNAVIVLGLLIFYTNYLIKRIMESENELKKMAQVDRLTNLYNRHYMMTCLNASAMGTDKAFVAMADIDDFKKINDTFGHGGGDEILRFVAKTIQSECEECVVARWGGEEFLILGNKPFGNAKEMLENLRRKIATERVEYEGKGMKVTLTIGLAYRKQEQNVDDWINEADEKLYYGKNHGKNMVVE